MVILYIPPGTWPFGRAFGHPGAVGRGVTMANAVELRTNAARRVLGEINIMAKGIDSLGT